MILEIIIFLVFGIGVGTFGTLVGIGGGLICVPIFILFMSDGGIYPYFKTAAQITGRCRAPSSARRSSMTSRARSSTSTSACSCCSWQASWAGTRRTSAAPT